MYNFWHNAYVFVATFTKLWFLLVVPNFNGWMVGLYNKICSAPPLDKEIHSHKQQTKLGKTPLDLELHLKEKNIFSYLIYIFLFLQRNE